MRRTPERRIRDWRAQNGADRDVIFKQVHENGLAGTPASPRHRTQWASTGSFWNIGCIHFQLANSGFVHAHVILGDETYVALAEVLQNVLTTQTRSEPIVIGSASL